MEHFEKCVNKYNELICCDRNWTNCLGECIDQFKFIEDVETNFKSENFISDFWGKCVVLNNKKKDFYKYSYDVGSLIKKIEKFSDVLPSNFLTNFQQIFDTNKYDNCCNCISIVLYYKYVKDKRETLDLYLPNIVATLKNINKYLPDWILRVYTDRTFFESLIFLEKAEDYLEMLKILSTNPQCEINMVFCEKFFKKDFKLGSLRTLRFLALCDPTVNIMASREADGIMSALDCHNLEILKNNDFMFATYELQTASSISVTKLREMDDDSQMVKFKNGACPFLADLHYLEKERIMSLYDSESRYVLNTTDLDETIKHSLDKKMLQLYYSEWLNNYKKIDILFNNDPFYLSHIELYPILAGLLSCKCKFKKDYYDLVQNKINETVKKFLKSNHDEIITDYFSVGYDEILLQELFRPVYSFQHLKNVDGTYGAINAKFLFENLMIIISSIDTPTNKVLPHSLGTYERIADKHNIIKFMETDVKHYCENKGENKFVYAVESVSLLNVTSGIKYSYISNDYKYNYEKKYLKYKKKYLQLKQRLHP